MKDENKKKTENETGYMAIGMCLGMSFGAALGLVLFHNLAVGISTGMCIGLCIGLLADAGVGIFAVSTYNTDYILVKQENFEKALRVLADAGYQIV